MMDPVFLFHAAILVLVGAIAIVTLRKWDAVTLIALLVLFAYHCATWGDSCTTCNLGDVRCVAELTVFWGVVLLWYLGRKGVFPLRF